MPITFNSTSGHIEQVMSAKRTVGYTVIVWHEETLRFVVIELTPKLYGLDISVYVKAITSQLKSFIPGFDQLVEWCNKIDPSAVCAQALVGQLFARGDKFELLLQASDRQIIWIQHQQKKYKLSIDQSGIKGVFSSGDQLIIGSQNVINNIDRETINVHKDLEVAFLGSMNKYPSESKILIIKSQSKRLSYFGWFRNIHFPQIKLKKNDKALPVDQEISLEKKVNFDSKRRVALGIALLFLALLIISVGLGMRKRSQLLQAQQQQQLITDVTYRLEQAKSLQDLNPARAKILLSQARQALNEYSLGNRLSSQTIKDLEQEVALSYEKVSGLILVQSAPLFYDPNLLKDGFVPSQTSLSEGELTLLDPTNRIVASVALASKAAKLVAGSNQVYENSRLASIPAWTFLLSGEKLAVIDKQTQKQIKSFVLSSTTVSDIIGYGNNLYILDVPAGQVLRFRGVKDGLSKSEQFFDEKQDLTGAVSLAIDGSVWILYDSGAIEKYTSGIRDALFSDFSLDKPLQQPSQLFTDENQKHLYVLDKNQGRIIAVTKQGEFKAEYTWEGLKTCDDFVVSEALGKILVLQSGKIWGIAIK